MKKIKAQKYTLIALACLAIIGLGASALIAKQNRRTAAETENPPGPGVNDNDDNTDDSGDTAKPADVAPPPAQPPTPPPTPNPAGSLATPTGQVLNKNLIRLASTEPQYDANMNSTCQTVVGAACGVRASMGGTVINIPAIAVDDRGVASIDWNAKAAGLTPGVWDIQVVASRDGKSGYSQTDRLTVEP